MEGLSIESVLESQPDDPRYLMHASNPCKLCET